MIKHPNVPEKWDLEADLVAAGSSMGGFAAVILGHDLGLKTVLVEKAETLGGGTALSGGAIWIPFNKYMLEMGITDSREETLGYIRRVSMGHHDEEILTTYVDTCNEVIGYLEKNTVLKLSPQSDASRTEYCPDLPGGKPMGRKLWPDPEVVPPILEEAEKKYPMLAKVRQDPVKYLIGPRPPWVQGRGLIGPLVMACVDRGIDMLTGTRARQLIVQDGRVVGLRAEREGKDFYVKANKGVLLATGGFEWNAEMNKRFIYSPPLGAYTAPTNEGDGHIMGMEVGAALALMDHSIFQPGVSLPKDIVEETGKRLYRPFIHGYPGQIMVNRHGKRCCDECFYPDIGRSIVAYDRQKGEYANYPVYWVCDQTLRDIMPIGNLRRGQDVDEWIVKADTFQELAEKIGVSADNLVETVERFNKFAREGRDPDFHRGESTFDKQWGDFVFPGRQPSPVLGPLEKPPFYGVKLEPTTAGNLGGLVTNTDAQVIDVRGEVIPGFYCTSNTQAMLLLGHHYDSGAAQGKSLVFGYIAARHMAKG